MKVISEIVEVNNATIGGAWTDISSDTYVDDDYLTISLIEGSGDRSSLDIGPVKYEDISSTYMQDQEISDISFPLRDAQQNLNSTAVTTSFVVTYVTSTAITPKSTSSKFLINIKGVGGSISGQARGDLQIQRKIGAGNWATQSGLSKNYVFLANFGNPPFGYGPIEDSPSTTDAVQYRAQIRRGSSGHTGTWNCESFFMTVTEVVSDPDISRTLRIRSNSSKIQYRLLGDVNATNKLRVLKHKLNVDPFTAITYASALTWDVETDPVATVTLTGNVSSLTVNNTEDGGVYVLKIKQDATGSRTFAFPSAWKWAGGSADAISSGSNDEDILTIRNIDGVIYAAPLLKDVS